MSGSALELALASELEARTSKVKAAEDLARAEETLLKAVSTVQEAKEQLRAREAAWHAARDVAWHAAKGELCPEHLAHDDHDDHGHGHGQDDISGAACHQLQHRWVEKTAFGCTERVVHGLGERMVEQGGERLAERAGRSFMEAGAERVAERTTEVMLEKAGASAANHLATRALGETLRMGEHATIHALKALRVLVPFVGMLFVFHLAEHDWRRVKEECAAGRLFTTLLFLLAVSGDLLDIWAHGVVVSSGLIDMDHHFVHLVEYYGMGSAVVACLSVMSGEILSARARRRAAKRASVRIVPCAADGGVGA